MLILFVSLLLHLDHKHDNRKITVIMLMINYFFLGAAAGLLALNRISGVPSFFKGPAGFAAAAVLFALRRISGVPSFFKPAVDFGLAGSAFFAVAGFVAAVFAVGFLGACANVAPAIQSMAVNARKIFFIWFVLNK